MKHFIKTALVAVLSVSGAATVTATTHDSTQAHAQHHAAFADGEVRRVDKDARKITIRHGAIANLEMPPMTMVFQVRDAALLENVKPGDKIRFAADKVDGAYVMTQMEQAQ